MQPRRTARSAQSLDVMEMLAVAVASQGFAVVPDVVGAQECEVAVRHLDATSTQGAGSRRLLAKEWCQSLARLVRHNVAISSLLPKDAVAVQCIFFDKSPTKNWLVALHQDRSIPVRERATSSELTGWSEKEGDLFVQPPSSVLEQLIAVRIHLDPCPVENGALRVVPGSHRAGILSTAEADQLRDGAGEKTIPVSRGGALIIKPLILHGSSKSRTAAPRRVMHFVFGPRELPLGLKWQHAI